MTLTAPILLQAYAAGVFPMAEAADDPELFWVDPQRRGILPLDRVHVSRSLARRIRRGDYSVTIDQDFAGVVQGCADRPETWINAPLYALYQELHAKGFAHSVEIRQNGVLVGGLFGIALGAAFFGESMFSRATDASKLALVHLVARLRAGGFQLCDTQFLTPHLASLGAIEISRADYRRRLAKALESQGDFSAGEDYSVWQRSTQMS